MKISALLALTLVWIFSGIFSSRAFADNLNVFAGSNLGSDEAGLVVGELAVPVIAEVGPFFEWSRNTGAGPENRYTFGLVGRLPSPWLNFFADARLGYNINSAPIDVSDRDGLRFELGIGYRFFEPVVDIMPRIGFNVARSNSDIPVVNLTVGLAFVL